jgi:2-polyprenyl-3-methyl-5-hydroxy-6-metoxy-1,4-benzoquinol methylase
MLDNEGVRAEGADRCLLCGGAGERLYSGLRDRLFRAPGVWAFFTCRGCGLVWLSPRPLPDDLAKLYATYYTHETEPPAVLPRLRQAVRRGVLAAAFGYHSLNGRGLASAVGAALSVIAPVRDRVGMGISYLRHTDGGRLLDIGCGGGLFLSRMRELGWDVEGVDPDPAAAALARRELGLRIFVGDLEQAGFPEQSFDAVTLNHVIEHVPDPVGLLRQAWRLVRPRGRLVVITPNVASLAHRLHRSSWYCLDPPRHLLLFSRQTLALCARQAGIPAEELRTSSRLAPHTWSASRAIARTGKGPPERAPTRTMVLEGALFQVVEECARFMDRDAGEELLLMAPRGLTR